MFSTLFQLRFPFPVDLSLFFFSYHGNYLDKEFSYSGFLNFIFECVCIMKRYFAENKTFKLFWEAQLNELNKHTHTHTLNPLFTELMHLYTLNLSISSLGKYSDSPPHSLVQFLLLFSIIEIFFP